MLKTIIAVTDCTGLPRPTVGIGYMDTWVGQLGCLCVVSGGGYNIAELRRAANVLSCFKGSCTAVVIQIGLGDCAPRPLTTAQGLPKLIGCLPKPILWRLRPFIQARFGWWQFTPIEQFEVEYRALVTLARAAAPQVISIGIAPVNEYDKRRSPELPGEIVKYNEVIKTMQSDYISLDMMAGNEKLYLADNAHITKAAHGWVYRQLQL